MTELDIALGKPHLQRSEERTGRVLDQVSDPVVGDRVMPMLQDSLGSFTVSVLSASRHGGADGTVLARLSQTSCGFAPRDTGVEGRRKATTGIRVFLRARYLLLCARSIYLGF